MTIVSMVPTILQDIDFSKLLALLSFPGLEEKSFLANWSKIMKFYTKGKTKVYKPYNFYRLNVKKILFSV